MEIIRRNLRENQLGPPCILRLGTLKHFPALPYVIQFGYHSEDRANALSGLSSKVVQTGACPGSVAAGSIAGMASADQQEIARPRSQPDT
jgi:hypothetical protein